MKPDDKVAAVAFAILILVVGFLIAFNIWRLHDTHRACLEARGSMIADGCQLKVKP